ncbi:hypothetical protein EXE42_02500 [Halorubrum sp. SP3]|nr:hypothetical protein EXE42_02500 [Halorubrum sp. SP3]
MRSSVARFARSLRCLRRLRRPRDCSFESHPTATARHLTPPRPRRSRLKALATPSHALSPAAKPPAVRETSGLSLLAPAGRSEARATALS